MTDARTTGPRRPAAALLGLLLLGGCPLGDELYPKPEDLTPDWKVDKLRVLGIRAEPPEIAPGESARFEALVVDPDGQAGFTVWVACELEDDIGIGCPLDVDFDFESFDLQAAQDAGLIGFEPFLAPVYTAPADILDGLETCAADDGIYVLGQVSILPDEILPTEDPPPDDGSLPTEPVEGPGDAGDLGSGEGGDDTPFDFNQVEVGVKRLVVSSNAEPNANPAIAYFTLDGQTIPAGAVIEVDPGETYDVGVVPEPDSAQTYTYAPCDGEPELRTEEPYVAWFTDSGRMVEQVTLWGFLEATWVAPEADGDDPLEGTWWAVMRDRRGGMAWAEQRWRVRPLPPGADTDE